MKTYLMPQLKAQGTVVEITKTIYTGILDPFNMAQKSDVPPGSLGFQL